jgi:membrane-associated protein
MDITGNFYLILMIVALISPFGIPVGATFFIISAGSQSGTFTDYAFFVTLIFMGFLTGDIAAYKTASYFEETFTKKLCKYDSYNKKCNAGKNFLNKYGGMSIFLSRFVLLGLGAPVNYVSGFGKYPIKRFLIWTASGEFLYAAIYTYIGFAFKDSWIFLFDVIVEFSTTGILLLATLFALYKLKKYHSFQ